MVQSVQGGLGLEGESVIGTIIVVWFFEDKLRAICSVYIPYFTRTLRENNMFWIIWRNEFHSAIQAHLHERIKWTSDNIHCTYVNTDRCACLPKVKLAVIMFPAVL